MDLKHFFETKIFDKTYQISDPFHGPNEDGKSLLPGKATRNSYLLIGDKSALLIDMALEDQGLHLYATLLAHQKVNVALSHGHIDHIYHLENEKEVWVHPDDQPLITQGAFPFQPPLSRVPSFKDLHDGEILDLGNRLIDVIHIPGHTDGSIAFYDRKSQFLFSGDTISRRLLYGMHKEVPINVFCQKLQEIKKLDIQKIYTAHDRVGLPKSHIDLMLKVMQKEEATTSQSVELPGLGTLTTEEYGVETDLAYFSFCYKEDRQDK